MKLTQSTILKGFLLFFALSCIAFAGEGSSNQYGFSGNGSPIGTFFPAVNGIIFPPLPIAAGINPAALPQRKPDIGAEVTYSPPPTPGDPNGAFASLGMATKELGFGLGYSGGTGSNITHGAFLGGGVKTQALSVGLAVRAPDFRTGTPDADLGILGELKNDITYGFVLYGMQQAPQMDFGIGFGRSKSFNFEVNCLFPPIGIAFQRGSEYIFTAATSVQLGFFGLHFKSNYSTKTFKITQTVSILAWIAKPIAIAVQFTSPNRSQYGILFNF